MADFPFGNLLSSAASLIGGHSDRGLQKKSMTHGIRYRVADARAAGIHPLAALGASLPSPSYTPHVGDAVGAGLERVGNAVAGVGEERARLENARLEAEIRRLNQETTNLASATSRTTIGTARRLNQTTDGVDRLKPPERTTSLGVTRGGRIVTAPGVSDAQTYQDRYGDIAEEIAGLGIVLPQDILHTLRIRERNRRVRRGVYGAGGDEPTDQFGRSLDYRRLWR